MEREHDARITWSDAHLQRGLVARTEWIAPAWFVGDPPDADGWSLVCRFEVAPAEQGSPSAARIRLWRPHAPHERLRPGAVLRLFEDVTLQLATVEVLD
ncbi:MAG TPA: hypothetical protein VGD56_09380 [Gemmatirosa sp.]